MTIGGVLAVIGVVALVYAGTFFVAAAAALYLFLTIRFDDACILDFLWKAVVYFLVKPQQFRWKTRGGDISSRSYKT